VSESAENAILAQLEAMRAELKAELAALRDRAVLPEAMKVAKANVVGARCATCHAPEVADDAGGGVHLLNADGSVAKLRAVELRAVARVLNNDSMPKGTKDKPLPRLTAEEKAEVARLFGLEPSKGPSPAPKLPIPKK
jgi:mono/diheme cytochrome c family protein